MITDQTETATSLEELSERLGPHIGKTIRLDNPAVPFELCKVHGIGPLVTYGELKWLRYREGEGALRIDMGRKLDIGETRSDFLWLDSTVSVLMDGAWKIIHRPEGAKHSDG